MTSSIQLNRSFIRLHLAFPFPSIYCYSLSLFTVIYSFCYCGANWRSRLETEAIEVHQFISFNRHRPLKMSLCWSSRKKTPSKVNGWRHRPAPFRWSRSSGTARDWNHGRCMWTPRETDREKVVDETKGRRKNKLFRWDQLRISFDADWYFPIPQIGWGWNSIQYRTIFSQWTDKFHTG